MEKIKMHFLVEKNSRIWKIAISLNLLYKIPQTFQIPEKNGSDIMINFLCNQPELIFLDPNINARGEPCRVVCILFLLSSFELLKGIKPLRQNCWKDLSRSLWLLVTSYMLVIHYLLRHVLNFSLVSIPFFSNYSIMLI